MTWLDSMAEPNRRLSRASRRQQLFAAPQSAESAAAAPAEAYVMMLGPPVVLGFFRQEPQMYSAIWSIGVCAAAGSPEMVLKLLTCFSEMKWSRLEVSATAFLQGCREDFPFGFASVDHFGDHFFRQLLDRPFW